MTTSFLAEPLGLPCGATLPNRLAKASMSEGLATADGRPTSGLTRLYETWGRSGAGLLLTGNTMTGRDGLTEPGAVILDDDRDLAAVHDWTAAGRAGGAAMWLQVNHPGRMASVPLTRRPVAPSTRRSTVVGYNFRDPRTLTGREIEDLVTRFATTARLAVAGGFDGVQVHAAHGYLLSQFLSPLTNTRTDAWGGDPRRRMRLLLEIVAAVRAEVGAGVPVGVKLNCKDFVHGGFTEEEALGVAVALDAAEIDLLEISGGGYEQPAMTGLLQADGDRQEAYFADFALRVRTEVVVPLMLTGGLRTPELMEDLVRDGTVDVVGIARPMAFVPDFPRRILLGQPVDLPRPARRIGSRSLDGYVDLAAHSAQLHRLATGRRPQSRIKASAVVSTFGRTLRTAVRQASIPG